MTDHIQPEPVRRPTPDRADIHSPDPSVDELLHRVQVLEQEKGRRKVIVVSVLIGLILLVVGGGIVGVGSATVYAYRLKKAHRRAMEAEMRARDEAERAKIEAEQAQREFQRANEEAKRKAAKEAK